MFWSNVKSDSSSNMKNVSNTKSSWFKLKSDKSYNIENISNNKISWSKLKLYPSYNIENTSSKDRSNNTDRVLINNNKDITTAGNEKKR